MMEEEGEDGARRKRKVRFDTANFTGVESHATRTCWWEWSKAEEEDSTEDFGVGTDFAKVLNPSDGINVDITNPMCPRFCFEEEEKARLMKPFGRTLVVKLLGRQPSYGFMLKKLRQIWERKGSIDVFDLQNDFYLVKFQRSEDYMEALTGGPWVINDAYLNVSRWRPDFNPKNERIASVVAWVRLPDLPAPLFDKKFLLNLGNVIGKAIKLDIHTAQRARGKFARMCVELDLTKPLVPEFEVEGQVLNVVYESMGLLCTRCGVFGHTRESCEQLQRRKNEARMDVEEAEKKEEIEEVNVVKRDKWKTVQRNRRQRFPYEPAKFQQSGSRFSVLGEEEGEEHMGRRTDEVRVTKPLTENQERGSVKVQDREQKRQGKHVNMEVEKQGSKESSLKGGSVDYVPEANLEMYRASKVEYNNKENLQPGIQQDRPGCFDAMDMEKVQSWGKEEYPNASADLGSIKEFTTPVLAKASRGIAAAIRNLKKQYNLDVIVILEPRISGNRAKKCIKSWGFNQSCRMEAEEFSGGIWIVWERADLIVDTLVKDQHFIHCRLILGSESTTFSAVYASPTENRRSRSWEDLYKISCDTSDPWLIAGDFNEIKSPLEQKGGGRINETRCRKFNDWIQNCNLLDIEAGGPFFTWKWPKWEGLERVYKRLDRCLCNAQWQERFNKADVRVLPRIGSDHHPIVIRLEEEVN
ncbi:hypothetical protein K1719_045090 [Acacia pycnantha]|nr:hypothetical protein K1719_045090 [Acacia pycnantha]